MAKTVALKAPNPKLLHKLPKRSPAQCP